MASFCDHCGEDGHTAARHGDVSPVVQGVPSAWCKVCKTEFSHAPCCPNGPTCPSCDDPATDYDEGLPVFHCGTGCPLDFCEGCGFSKCHCDDWEHEGDGR